MKKAQISILSRLLLAVVGGFILLSLIIFVFAPGIENIIAGFCQRNPEWCGGAFQQIVENRIISEQNTLVVHDAISMVAGETTLEEFKNACNNLPGEPCKKDKCTQGQVKEIGKTYEGAVCCGLGECEELL